MSENTNEREAFEMAMGNRLKARIGISALEIRSDTYTFQVTRMAWESWLQAIAHKKNESVAVAWIDENGTLFYSKLRESLMPLFFEPQQNESVAELLEKAINIARPYIEYNYEVNLVANEIRALIKDGE